jgi:glyoxylase-like metal-dependent hydrolase (beta-lactamase superfamily II)
MAESSAVQAHVEAGGGSWQADLGRATVRKCSVSTMDNNAYLITCTRTGHQVLIDAADDPDRLGALVAEGTDRLDAVVTTHGHWDHHRALASVVETFGPVSAAGSADADDLPVPPDRHLEHGDTLTVGELDLAVLGLRGHTPGSVALALADDDGTVHLFTGDSLFPGGPGKTASPSDFTTLMDDLLGRVFDRYGDDTVVHPGHGDSTTLGHERPHLWQWRERGW